MQHPVATDSAVPRSEILSIKQAAERLGCHRATVHRALADGRLNPVEVAGRRAVKVDKAFRDFVPVETGRRVENDD